MIKQISKTPIKPLTLTQAAAIEYILARYPGIPRNPKGARILAGCLLQQFRCEFSNLSQAHMPLRRLFGMPTPEAGQMEPRSILPPPPKAPTTKEKLIETLIELVKSL